MIMRWLTLLFLISSAWLGTRLVFSAYPWTAVMISSLLIGWVIGRLIFYISKKVGLGDLVLILWHRPGLPVSRVFGSLG
jgi:hypothetical protein